MSDVAHVQAMLDAPEPVAADGLAPIHHGKFTFTGCGLQVYGAPTFDEWAEVGGVLAVMERGLAFLVGDWIAYGEGAYGEAAAQVIDARNWKPETVRNYTWLAKQVPIANRMLDRGLTVAHHQVVAARPPGEQRMWLRRALADAEPWTVSRLRAAIKDGVDAAETGWYLFVTCASAEKRDALQKQLELDGYACKAITKRSV